MITQEYLKTILYYNKDTGIFTWLKGNNKSVKAGDIAGYLDSRGYVVIKYKKAITAHRLAWLYVYGEWPKNQIDHINGIRNDNKINNLREVTLQENGRNRPEHRAGHLVGSTFEKKSNKWKLQIQIAGQKIYLGYYNTKEEAHKAYLDYTKRSIKMLLCVCLAISEEDYKKALRKYSTYLHGNCEYPHEAMAIIHMVGTSCGSCMETVEQLDEENANGTNK